MNVTLTARRGQRADLRRSTQAMYALHLLSWLALAVYAVIAVVFNEAALGWFALGVFSVIALAMNYALRRDLTEHLLASHFRWQSRSFWYGLAGLVATAPLWLLTVFGGHVAWAAIGLWVLARLVRGWRCFAARRPMPVDTRDLDH